MRTLAEYKNEVRGLPPFRSGREMSGIECPTCRTELDWTDRSLIETQPPKRRLLCRVCRFTEMVICLK
jgi:hypothetical protein